MGNGKTSVLALFPASEQKIPIIYKKKQSFFALQGANKKNSILALTPTLKLNPNCNPSSNSNPNVNPNTNSKSKLQLTINNHNLKNKKHLST